MRISLSIIAMVFMMATFLEGAAKNRSALDEDTALVSGLKAGVSKYSKWFPLGDAEDMAAIVKIDDTTSDGFSGDSIAVIVGYQVSCPVFDSSDVAKNEKYARSVLYVLDTLLTDSLGKAEAAYGYESDAGVITEAHGLLDTTNVYGWATWRRTFYPKWGVFIRFFFVPLTGHCNTATPVELKLSRRQFIYVKTR